MNSRICSMVIATFIVPTLVTAQVPRSARDALLACSDIREGVARLDCFDRAAEAQKGQGAARTATPTTAPATSATPAAPAAPAQTPSSSIGEEQLRRSSTDDAAEAPKVLHARITESRRGSGGVYLLTLDNGHVWRHEQGSMAAYLKAGEAVTISPASLGSYRLTLDSGSSKNWVRVTRVR